MLNADISDHPPSVLSQNCFFCSQLSALYYVMSLLETAEAGWASDNCQSYAQLFVITQTGHEHGAAAEAALQRPQRVNNMSDSCLLQITLGICFILMFGNSMLLTSFYASSLVSIWVSLTVQPFIRWLTGNILFEDTGCVLFLGFSTLCFTFFRSSLLWEIDLFWSSNLVSSSGYEELFSILLFIARVHDVYLLFILMHVLQAHFISHESIQLSLEQMC